MSQPLTLSFQSDTTAARNAIAQLASTVVTNMLTIGSAMKAASDNVGKLQSGMQALPGIVRGAAAAFVAFEAIKLSLNAIGAAAEAASAKLAEIVKVAHDAQNAGVGTNFFQQWAAQADHLSTSAERLASMLQRARDASTVNLGTGGNDNASTMQTLLGQHVAAGNIGQGDLDAFNAAKDQEARIRSILDLMDKLTESGRQLAALNIGATMFGKDFETQMRNGVNVVQQMRDAMSQTKDVTFPPDVIARGVEINKQLQDAEQRMREGWLPVQQDILRWQQDSLQSWANMKSIIADIAQLLGGWYTAIKNAENAASDLANKLPGIKAFAEWTKSLPEGIFGRMSGVEYLDDAGRQRLIDERNKPPQERDLTVPVGDKSKPLPGRASTASAGRDEVETYLDQLRKSVAVLEAEAQAYGKSNIEKAKAVDLAKAEEAARVRGTPLTEKERTEVLALADAEGKLKEQAEKRQKAQAEANAQAQFFGDQMISALDKIREGGAKVTDIMKDMTNALIKALEQSVLLGTGPFGSLFGLAGQNGNPGGLAGALVTGARSIFTPAQAEGGWAGSGPLQLVPAAAFANARRFADGGGIPSILHAGEIVLNAAQQKNVAGSMGGVTVINNHSGAQISTREVSDGQGGRKPQIVIDEMVSAAVQAPKTAGVMRSVYGARPAVARR